MHLSENNFAYFTTACDTRQLRVTHLFGARDTFVQFGGLVRLDVGVEHFGNFGRLTRCDPAGGDRRRDGSHDVGGIPRAGDRR